MFEESRLKIMSKIKGFMIFFFFSFLRGHQYFQNLNLFDLKKIIKKKRNICMHSECETIQKVVSLDRSSGKRQILLELSVLV